MEEDGEVVCKSCPLTKIIANCNQEDSPFDKFLNTNVVMPMIRALKKALKNEMA